MRFGLGVFAHGAGVGCVPRCWGCLWADLCAMARASSTFVPLIVVMLRSCDHASYWRGIFKRYSSLNEQSRSGNSSDTVTPRRSPSSRPLDTSRGNIRGTTRRPGCRNGTGSREPRSYPRIGIPRGGMSQSSKRWGSVSGTRAKINVLVIHQTQPRQRLSNMMTNTSIKLVALGKGGVLRRSGHHALVAA